MERRVVITGLGPITAFGVGMVPLWDAMVAGRSAIRSVDGMKRASMPCPMVAALTDFDVRQRVPKEHRKATKLMCRDIALAVGAADAAVADAGLVTRGTNSDAEPTYAPARFGCHVGAGLISADVDELTQALLTSRQEGDDSHGAPSVDLGHWGQAGMNNLTPLWLLKYLPNMLACHLTIIHDCRGPSNTLTCCEASSTLALGEAMRVIQADRADVGLVGGAEEKLNPYAFIRQFFAERLANPSPDQDPTTVVCPFDERAQGTVLGEGGGILVVEEINAARRRGAKIYAEVAGFAATQSACLDATGLEIDPADSSIARAIELARASARIDPADVDAVVPFGSSIPQVDQPEAMGMKKALGHRVRDIPLVTTVPYVGNCNAGNGAIGLAVAAQALFCQELPARLNTTRANGLNANACPARTASLNAVLVLATGQGGQNAAVLLKRVAP